MQFVSNCILLNENIMHIIVDRELMVDKNEYHMNDQLGMAISVFITFMGLSGKPSGECSQITQLLLHFYINNYLPSQ